MSDGRLAHQTRHVVRRGAGGRDDQGRPIDQALGEDLEAGVEVRTERPEPSPRPGIGLPDAGPGRSQERLPAMADRLGDAGGPRREDRHDPLDVAIRSGGARGAGPDARGLNHLDRSRVPLSGRRPGPQDRPKAPIRTQQEVGLAAARPVDQADVQARRPRRRKQGEGFGGRPHGQAGGRAAGRGQRLAESLDQSGPTPPAHRGRRGHEGGVVPAGEIGDDWTKRHAGVGFHDS